MILAIDLVENYDEDNNLVLLVLNDKKVEYKIRKEHSFSEQAKMFLKHVDFCINNSLLKRLGSELKNIKPEEQTQYNYNIDFSENAIFFEIINLDLVAFKNLMCLSEDMLQPAC